MIFIIGNACLSVKALTPRFLFLSIGALVRVVMDLITGYVSSFISDEESILSLESLLTKCSSAKIDRPQY